MDAIMNQYGIEMQRAQEIVNIADGDFNKAKWLTNEPDNAQSVNMFREWMLGIYKGDIPALVKFSDSFHTETMEVQKNFLVYCLHLFRESIVKVSNAGDLARTTSSERVFLDKFAKTVNPEAVVEMRHLIDDVLWQIDRHANAKMLMMALSLRMIPAKVTVTRSRSTSPTAVAVSGGSRLFRTTRNSTVTTHIGGGGGGG
eukprot:gene772-1019_t